MKFIGRKSELSKLNAEYNRDSSFVVIYGRRRVGKTTLIKEFLKKKNAFYFLATEEVESQSMKRLAGVVARTTKNTLLQKAAFTDWLDLFQVIADYKPGEKKVLVIDEFPYLVKTNSAFPSILQNAWDEILKDNNVMLILSGSLIGMMQKYHAKPVDAPVYFALKEKVDNATEIHKDFPGYEVIYGVFSKSGFTQRMLDIAKENSEILLVNEDRLV